MGTSAAASFNTQQLTMLYHWYQMLYLQLNGHDRFSKQNGRILQAVQPHNITLLHKAGVNVYSFALNPEEHQPSGTCNFSRIDNATLKLQTNAGV